MKKISLLILLGFILTITSCNYEEPKDDTVKLDPKNAIDITIKINHANNFDVMSTTKIVHDNWSKKLIKTYKFDDNLFFE